MNKHSWVDPRLAQVQADQARAYMLSHGWKLQPYPRKELLVFGGQVDDDNLPILLTLSSSEHCRDYLGRLEELIRALSILEDRTPRDVLDEMLRVPILPPTLPSAVDVATVAPDPK